MAYNIRGKTLSTVIPQSLYSKYPNFITFLDKYYDFSRKSVIELNSSVGNINLSSKFYGMTSEFYVDREVTNTLDKSYTVDFNEKRTFLPSEDIVALRPLTSSLSFTLGIDREYVFDKILEPKLTFYYDQQYVIENNTGATVYIKDQQTAGSANQYSTGVVIDGTTITITTTSSTPRLYYTVDGYSDIGIIDVEVIPPAYTYVVENVINTGLPGTAGYTNSVYGFGNISNVLFNPDYLIDNYNTITTVDAPDALFFKYLDSQGLGNLFSQTIVNRSSIDDFTRFLQAKGTANAVKFFFRSFFDQDVEVDYPGDDQLKASDGDFFVQQQMFITATKPLELTRNRRLKGQSSGTYATIESQQFSAENDYYIVAIDKDKIDGTFIINEKILVIDNTDSDIEYDIEGTLYGTVGGIEVIQPGLEYDRNESITNTYTLEGVAREAIVSVDDITSSSIEHVDINTVLTHAAHTGAAFTVGETITQATTGATGVVRASTVDVTTVQNLNTGTWGTANNVTGGTSSVTLSSSHLSAVASGGTNYAVGDKLLFPKPAEQVTFSATIDSSQLSPIVFSGPNNEYTYIEDAVPSIKITLEDDAKNAVLFTTDSNTYDLAIVEINGINYTATDIVEGTPDVLTLPAVDATGLTIRSGQSIKVTIGADKIVDRFYDASFFDTSATVTTVDASGYVSRVNDTTGAIEEIQMSSGGAGYKKRPTTDRLLPDASTKSIAAIPTDSHSLTHPSILANNNIITHPKFSSIRSTQTITLNHDHMANPFRAGIGESISQATTLATGIVYSTITKLTLTPASVTTGFVRGEILTQGGVGGGIGKILDMSIVDGGDPTLGGSPPFTVIVECFNYNFLASGDATMTGGTLSSSYEASAYETLQTNVIVSNGAFNTAVDVVDGTRTLAAADLNSIIGETSHFVPDEEVRGVTSGATGKALNKTVQITHGAQSDFAAGDKLTGGTSGATGTIAVRTSTTVNQLSQSVNSNRFVIAETVSNNVTNLTHGGASSGAFTVGNTMSKGTARGTITEVVDSTHVKVRVSVGTFTTGTITEEETSKTATASNIGAFSTATTSGTLAPKIGMHLNLTDTSGTFISGEKLVGVSSGASASVCFDLLYMALHANHSEGDMIKGATSGAEALIIERDTTIQGKYDANDNLLDEKLVCTNLFSMNKQFTADADSGTAENTTNYAGGDSQSLKDEVPNIITKFNGSPYDDVDIEETIHGLSSSAAGAILDFNDANTTDTTTTIDLSSGAYTVGETIVNVTGRLATTISSIKSSFDVGETVKQETVTLTHADTGAAFVVGRTLTGQTSGATGRIKTETSNTITILTNVIGTFVVSEDISQSVDDKTVAITASGVGATNTIATGLITFTNDTRTVITNKTGTFNTSDILSGASSKMVAIPSAANGGADADMSVFGEDFGGIIKATLTNNIIGITRNHEVVLTRSDVADITGENANINLLSGYYNDYGKEFKSVAGNLSESLIKITDSYKYQDFSYLIKTSLSYSAFSNLFKKLAHPAGMIFFNDFLLVNSFQQKLNKGVATATKEIRINIQKTSVTKLAHAAQTFTKGRKITGGTSGATGKVAVVHHRLLTTLDVVRGTFVVGETLTEEISSNTAVVASSGVTDIDKLHLIFSASSLSAIRDFFVRYHIQRPFDDQFQWLNESLVSFSNYISSGSDAYNNSNLISTYVDVPINEKSIVKRDGVRGIPFQNFRQTENVKTVTGTGTVGFADTSTVAANGPPGPVITVTGGSSDFINQCSPRDIITAGAHTLLVVAVASDTSLTAQRTSAAGSTGTVSGQAYTIAQKRINELNNATFDDLIQHGYAMTIQDVNRQFLSGSELTMDQFQDVFAV